MRYGINITVYTALRHLVTLSYTDAASMLTYLGLILVASRLSSYIQTKPLLKLCS